MTVVSLNRYQHKKHSYVVCLSSKNPTLHENVNLSIYAVLLFVCFTSRNFYDPGIMTEVFIKLYVFFLNSWIIVSETKIRLRTDVV